MGVAGEVNGNVSTDSSAVWHQEMHSWGRCTPLFICLKKQTNRSARAPGEVADDSLVRLELRGPVQRRARREKQEGGEKRRREAACHAGIHDPFVSGRRPFYLGCMCRAMSSMERLRVLTDEIARPRHAMALRGTPCPYVSNVSPVFPWILR